MHTCRQGNSHGSAGVPLELTTGMGVDISLAAHDCHCFGPGGSHEEHFPSECFGHSFCRRSGATSTGDHPWSSAPWFWHRQAAACGQRRLQRRQRNSPGNGLALLHQSNMYCPVGAGDLAKLSGAVEWVNDPDAVSAQSDCGVLALFRQDGIVGAGCLQLVHEQVVAAAITLVFAKCDVGFREFGPHRNEQLACLLREFGGQVMIILHNSRG